jgi:hypothetical protein
MFLTQTQALASEEVAVLIECKFKAGKPGMVVQARDTVYFAW